jgi:hypothetical protein
MTSYESKADRSNERVVADLVGRYLGRKLKKTPPYFPADYVAEGESAYVEVRCRTCTKERYGSFVISAMKWVELLRLKFDELEPKVFLAVAWADSVGLLELDFGRVELVPFHRKGSVGTYKDDVMVSIPTSEFEVISGGLKLAESKNWVG